MAMFSRKVKEDQASDLSTLLSNKLRPAVASQAASILPSDARPSGIGNRAPTREERKREDKRATMSPQARHRKPTADVRDVQKKLLVSQNEISEIDRISVHYSAKHGRTSFPDLVLLALRELDERLGDK